MMHAEPALAHKPKTDYGIEALKPSLLGRLIEKLLGPKN
jgi:hypothetical protein